MGPEHKVRFLHKAGIGGYDDDAFVRMFVEEGVGNESSATPLVRRRNPTK